MAGRASSSAPSTEPSVFRGVRLRTWCGSLRIHAGTRVKTPNGRWPSDLDFGLDFGFGVEALGFSQGAWPSGHAKEAGKTEWGFSPGPFQLAGA